MTDYKGSCLCGAVKYTVDGEFDSFYLCHCTYCQKDTGTAHAANLFSREAILTWVSGENDITTYHLPETRHCKSFCKHCGSSLPTYEVPGVLLVPVGSLDTQITLKPTARIFMASRATWEDNCDQVPEFDAMPKQVDLYFLKINSWAPLKNAVVLRVSLVMLQIEALIDVNDGSLTRSTTKI